MTQGNEQSELLVWPLWFTPGYLQPLGKTSGTPFWYLTVELEVVQMHVAKTSLVIGVVSPNSLQLWLTHSVNHDSHCHIYEYPP